MTIFYTVQHLEAWLEFQRTGFIRGYKERAMFPKEYGWLKGQMEKRVSLYQGDYPVWLWTEKPESFEGHLPYGQKGVLLTVDLPEEQVLLSDFDMWHFVLNNITIHTKEQAASKVKDISKEISWEHIFDLNFFRRNYTEEYEDYEPIIQGTTGCFSIKKVIEIEFFIAPL